MEIKSTQLQERLSTIYELVIDGLTTDGGHHKQWFLEEILKAVVGEENYTRIWEDFEGASEADELWEPGIAP